jgi:Amt family ammonium transporter
MKRLILTAVLFLTLAARAPSVFAADVAAKKPMIEDRVADLEAYVTNGARQTNAPTALTDSPGPGHNAWMMASAALVLFMTLPGLALFYGGLVRRRNVLSVLAQCLGITGLVTILWWLFGYSFVFANTSHAGAWLGDFGKYALLDGVDSVPNADYGGWVSHNVFSMYQMMFAIITPALIVGAIAERMKFSAVLLFVGLWMVIVYFPLAHWVWGANGAMNGVWNADARIKAIDFAGGTVVHMSSGWSALILCILVGKRLGYGKQPMPPHSMVLCMVGTGMLWVGWYGFNAGSAVAADVVAANAFITTTMATAVASFTWAVTEWLVKGKPSILGFCSGVVAGLVVITPACGFVTVSGAVFIGILAGIIPFLACAYLKPRFGYDDALDTFGVHAVGGTLGALLTGCLARTSANANLKINLKDYVTDHFLQPLVGQQLLAMIITIVLAVVGTTVIAMIVKAVVGLRPGEDVENMGLDLAEHGEEGYHEA